MRLTVEDNPETVRRYAHIKPSRGPRTRLCSARCPGTKHNCTRAKDHRPPHVAHGLLGKVLAVWDSGSATARRPTVDPPAKPTAGRRTGYRTPSSPGLDSEVRIFEALRERLSRVISSPDELLFIILFVAFVGFVIHWFTLIAG